MERSRASASPRYFPSKRDAWIVLLIWAGAITAAVGGIAQLTSDASIAVRLLMFVVLLGAAAFMLWILYSTGYLVGSDQLLIRCGPFRYRVPLDEIDSVTPSHNPLSSPACSLDRLLVRWAQGRRRILISPDSKTQFLNAIRLRCTHLVQQGEGLARNGGG